MDNGSWPVWESVRPWGPLLLAGLLMTGGVARGEDSARPAVIDFVSLGGIEDWRAEGADAMLIRGRNGSWYRARFFGPCIGLRFRESVAFVTDGTDRLDRFSSVLVDGERCWFRSFEKIPGESPQDSSKSEKR